jgi:hypothetical protein
LASATTRRDRLASWHVAVEADRGPANTLNYCEDRLAFLAADRITEDAAEKTDIVSEAAVIRHFQTWMPYGPVVPDVDAAK